MTAYLHPGVYIEEIPSGVKPIEGVPTSIAAFLGYSRRGPIDEAVYISKWEDYDATFGGVFSEDDALGLSVQAFYLNGGKGAYIARLASDHKTSALPAAQIKGPDTVNGSDGTAKAINVLDVEAASPGVWGDDVHIQVSRNDLYSFDLEVGFMEPDPQGPAGALKFVAAEKFSNLNMNDKDANYAVAVVNGGSRNIRMDLSIAAAGKYIHGFARGDDLTGLTLADAEGEFRLNVDGLGVKTIEVQTQANWTKLKDHIKELVRALGEEPAYAAFAVDGALADGLKLTSGTQGASSSVSVKNGELAQLLKFYDAAGTALGATIHGAAHVVPQKMDSAVHFENGADGDPPGEDDYRKFFGKLVKVRDVSILVLPGQAIPKDGTGNKIVGLAIAHCEKTASRMVIVDPERGFEFENSGAVDAMAAPTSTYSVMYYPWINVGNPFYHAEKNPAVPRTIPVAPSGFAAGMWSKTDGVRGVWKAPAGVEARLLGVAGLQTIVEDDEQDYLNPKGLNCIRKLPGFGPVIWGARTLATKANPEWRYVPVRRTAIYIEQSIYNSIQWAVFEPNDHRLWASLRTNIDSFMNGLFRAGAFQGAKASEAYYVRCGLGDTMIQGDIDRGQVIVVVAFAPLKPAEFVIIRIRQKAGQNQ